ncbi:MAG: CNNM domain-containing protein [Kiritimatiellae bacterium]|nr:CNNM domain-containing protein [Kiritimatiellia bacterium]MDW8457710.1 CNNM domain-containing protein [Verrucomicrobiota bacterium]
MSALELILIVAGAAGSWFFSGMETGLISMNRLRLRHLVRRKVRGADILQNFLEHPDHLLGTMLVGNNIANTMLSVVAASVGDRAMGAAGAWLASVMVTLSLLIFCEYFPKAWFQSHPTRRCLPFASVLDAVARVLRPLSWLLMRVVRALVPLPSRREENSPPVITREELIHLTHETQKAGVLTAEEVRMITGVMELKSITAEQLMVPRDQIVYIHHDTSAEDIKLFARARAFNQFPVYDRNARKFIGIVYVMDVLCDPSPAGKTAKDYMRPPQLVDKDVPADHVLPRMRVTRQPVVLVTDGERGVIGMLTLERVVAEFAGA